MSQAAPSPRRAGSVRVHRRVLGELRELGLHRFQRLLVSEQYIRLYRLIDRWLEPGCRVLDWGCGAGHVSYYLLRRGFETDAFAIEPAELAGSLAERYPRRFRFTLDPEARRQLPYESGGFDAVLSIGVLEHVRETGGDEIASLTEIERLLAPGGVFLCYHLPNRYSWIDCAARRLSPRLHRHDFRYTGAEVDRLLAAVPSLELRERRRYGLLPRLPWQGSPGWLGNARALASLYRLLDDGASALVPWWTQNYSFVAVKRPAGRPGASPPPHLG